MIKLYENIDKLTEEEYVNMFASLPEIIKQKVKRRKDEKLKKITIFEYFTLAKLLGSLDGLYFNENGKPLIEGRYFNMSHSGSYLCIALSDRQIGVDIQCLIDYDEKLVNHICSEEEKTKLESCQNKSKELTRLWCIKESIIKCEGGSLACNLKKINENEKYSISTSFKDKFCIAICEKKD